MQVTLYKNERLCREQLQMNITPIFPTAFAQIENPFLAHRVREQSHALVDATGTSPFFAYPSTFDPTTPEQKLEPVLEEMRLHLHNLSVEFLSTIGYRTDLMQLSTQLVFNRMTTGDTHQKHLHAGIVCSGTFYIDFPQESAPLVLHDPRLHRQMLPYPTDATTYTQSKYTTNLRTGSICLYEGYLEHSVPQNNTDGRLVVLFNTINNTVS